MRIVKGCDQRSTINNIIHVNTLWQLNIHTGISGITPNFLIDYTWEYLYKSKYPLK